jgi:kelch-like protein 18
MTCRRSRVGVAVLSNQIYAIGGYDGLANLSSVEVYKTDTQEWTPAPPLTCHQGGVVVAVIPHE